MYYEYRCSNDHITTQDRQMADRNVDILCSVCNQTATRILSAVPTTFRFADTSAEKGR